MAKLNERGHEELDPTPVARAIAFNAPPTLADQIKRLVQYELSRQAASEGQETFEEADDFDVGDDYDPRSPWELQADQEEALSHEQERRRENDDTARSRRFGRRKQRVDSGSAGKADRPSGEDRSSGSKTGVDEKPPTENGAGPAA